MKQDLLLNRRDMLIKGGKTFAAAMSLAALTGAGRPDLLAALATTNRANTEFLRNLEYEAAEELTFAAAQETCTLTCSQTLGPCYAAAGAIVRRDITQGVTGLPVRLGFRIVNADTCQPVTNASVDVWHTNASGIYSASTNQACTLGDTTARNQTFCRGVQLTDSDGLVYFDTIYPGWYSGRTTHIHFTIRVNNTEFVTSQFAFADRVNDFVYRKHPLYSRRPERTTTNTNDGVFRSLERALPFILETRYKASNQLQAFKTIAVSSSNRCSG